MYLRDLLIINSGPIEKLSLKPEFGEQGRPIPILLIGEAGSGKTSVLSIVADGLIEIANRRLNDTTPAHGAGQASFRVVGGRTLRQGAAFELSTLRFGHEDAEFNYVAKSGSVPGADLGKPSSRLDSHGPLKEVRGKWDRIETIFRTGVYAFFPEHRRELPYWIGQAHNGPDPALARPIVVESAIEGLKTWLIDLILDVSVDAHYIHHSNSIGELKARASFALEQLPVLNSFNAILRSILRRPDARLVRNHRGERERRFMIQYGDQPGLPSLDHLSAGQSTLLAIFGAILQRGDAGAIGQGASAISGIAVIDDADAHLDAELQHDVLPELIGMFPNVQFIMTSHAPLLPLGMRRRFGDSGFAMFELPRGTRIDAERFSEFGRSFVHLQRTKAAEHRLRESASRVDRPLIICQGPADPVYLMTAARTLGFQDIADGVEIDWAGAESTLGEEGGGKNNLDAAARFLRHNPQALKRETVLLYHSDADMGPLDRGRLHVRAVSPNWGNRLCVSGIENALPEAVFTHRAYQIDERRAGDRTLRPKLNRQYLLQRVCGEQVDQAHFEGFRSTLEDLRRTLFGD